MESHLYAASNVHDECVYSKELLSSRQHRSRIIDASDERTAAATPRHSAHLYKYRDAVFVGSTQIIMGRYSCNGNTKDVVVFLV